MLRADPRGSVDGQREPEDAGGLERGGLDGEKVGEEAEHHHELVAAAIHVRNREQRELREQEQTALHARRRVHRLDLRLVPHPRAETPVETVALAPEDGERDGERDGGSQGRRLLELVDRTLHLHAQKGKLGKPDRRGTERACRLCERA